MARNPPKEVIWLVEITVPKDPVPETVRAPVSISAVQVKVCKFAVPDTVSVLTDVFPWPFTKKGDEVPLKTWNPAPFVAMKPALDATDPEVKALVFTLPALTNVAATDPKVPVFDTVKVLAVAVVVEIDPNVPAPLTARTWAFML